MKQKIYMLVNEYGKVETINSKEAMDNLICKSVAEYIADRENFNSWLNSNYSGYELFFADENNKRDILERYTNECFNKISLEILSNWQESEVEI